MCLIGLLILSPEWVYRNMSVTLMYSMSVDTDGEMRQLNTRIPAVLDEEIENTWKARGFASKSEFVRHALRAAIGHVELSEETRAILKETEGELDRNEIIPMKISNASPTPSEWLISSIRRVPPTGSETPNLDGRFLGHYGTL